MDERAGVLIGFDDTAYGHDALALGLRLAEDTGEPAIVATVFPDAAERKLDAARVIVGVRPNVTFEAVESASASRGLHEFAERIRPQMIVLGSSEHSTVGRISPDSTVEQILNGAPAPVAVAPRGYRRRGGSIRRLAVAFDGQRESRNALAVASQLVQRLGGSLRLVCVTVKADGELQTALDRAAAAAPNGVKVITELIVDEIPSDTLTDLPGEYPDLLVCGSRGYGLSRQVLLGSVSTQLVRKAAYPVLVVPRPDASF